jgi:hypothetical protein
MGRSSDPIVALRELMREHELKLTDLPDVFGSQRVVVGEAGVSAPFPGNLEDQKCYTW